MINFHSATGASPNVADRKVNLRNSIFRTSNELPALKKTGGFGRSSIDVPSDTTFLTHTEVLTFNNRCRFLTNNLSHTIDLTSQMNSTRRSILSTCFKTVSANHPLFEPVINESGQQFRFSQKTIQEFGLKKQDIQLNKNLHKHDHIKHNMLIANNYKHYSDHHNQFRQSTDNKIHKENR